MKLYEYYCVIMKIMDEKTEIYFGDTVKSEFKPDNEIRTYNGIDTFYNYFKNKLEAQKYINENKFYFN